MAEQHTNWAHARLSVSMHPRSLARPVVCTDWRLEAKAPSEQWTTRATVGLGTHRVALGWPPTRDDVLGVMVELLLGMQWDQRGARM